MPKIKLKNVSTVKIGGKNPGQVFPVEADADGNPVDTFWRARLDEEAKFNVGAIVVVKAEPAPVESASVPASDPTADATPAPAAPKSKGKA